MLAGRPCGRPAPEHFLCSKGPGASSCASMSPLTTPPPKHRLRPVAPYRAWKHGAPRSKGEGRVHKGKIGACAPPAQRGRFRAGERGGTARLTGFSQERGGTVSGSTKAAQLATSGPPCPATGGVGWGGPSRSGGSGCCLSMCWSTESSSGSVLTGEVTMSGTTAVTTAVSPYHHDSADFAAF